MTIRCAYCRKVIGGRDVTRDHILPRRRLTELSLADYDFLGVIAARSCCRSCNQQKEMAGDCVGALFCARSVVDDQFRRNYLQPQQRYTKQLRRLLREWRLMYGATGVP